MGHPSPGFSTLGLAHRSRYARIHWRTMTKALDLDLKKLQARAFDRAGKRVRP
jgi:hypothetical protein